MINYYEILGLSNTATIPQIKKKYKELIKKWHPDKHQDDDSNKELAEVKFKQITSAYETLSDPEKKKHYDEFGECEEEDDEDLFSIPDMHFSPDFDNVELDSNIDQDYLQKLLGNIQKSMNKNEKLMYTRKKKIQDEYSDSEDSDSTNELDNESYTSEVRNAKIMGGKNKDLSKPSRKGQNIESELHLTMEEMYTGCRKQVNILKHVNKRIITSEKKKYNNRLDEIMDVLNVITVDIRPKSKPGDRIRLKCSGHHTDSNFKIAEKPGDLVIKLFEEPHKLFKRDGYNIVLNLNISYDEAMGGFTKRIVGLHGNQFNIKVGKLMLSNDYHVLKNKGFWIKGDMHGDMIIKFVIDLDDNKKVLNNNKKLK